MVFCISFGKFDKNIFYPISAGILKFIFKLILPHTHLTDHPLILSICSSLGMSLSLFLFLIYKFRSRSKLNKSKTNKSKSNEPTKKKTLEIELEYNNQNEEIPTDKFRYIFLSAVLDFIMTIMIYFFCINLKLNLWMFDILFICMFSHVILKSKLYKHQYLCLMIIIILGILININLYVYRNESKIEIIEVLIKYFSEIIFSLGIVLNKFTIEKKFASPYEICFYQGIINLVLYIICLIIFNDLDDYFTYWNELNNIEVYLFLIIMIIQFIFNLFIFITLKKFTACHILIIIVIAELEPFCKDLLNNNFNSIIIIIELICILFILLIFNEIIEINCCGLQKNTKKNIIKRAEIELEMSINGCDEQNQRSQSDVESLYEEKKADNNKNINSE